MQTQNFAEQIQEEFLFYEQKPEAKFEANLGIGLSSLSGEVREFPVTLRWTQSCLARIESQSTAQSCSSVQSL